METLANSMRLLRPQTNLPHELTLNNFPDPRKAPVLLSSNTDLQEFRFGDFPSDPEMTLQEEQLLLQHPFLVKQSQPPQNIQTVEPWLVLL